MADTIHMPHADRKKVVTFCSYHIYLTTRTYIFLVLADLETVCTADLPLSDLYARFGLVVLEWHLLGETMTSILGTSVSQMK
jgi:hypothetical protein